MDIRLSASIRGAVSEGRHGNRYRCDQRPLLQCQPAAPGLAGDSRPLPETWRSAHRGSGRGELGLAKVLEGEPIGSEEIGSALWHAKDSGDVSNELRFRTAIARLYLMVGRNHDALGHLERAVELAEREQALAYFPAYFEEAVAFLDDHRLQDALPLVDHCAAQARISGTSANNAQA